MARGRCSWCRSSRARGRRLVAALRQAVADRRAERAGQDVGEPEREHRVEPEARSGRWRSRRWRRRRSRSRRRSRGWPLGDQVAGRGAEREREQDREPVERLARVVTIVWIDSVRSTAYQTANTTARIDREDGVLVVSGDAVAVGQVVGDQRAEDADDHDDRASRRRARSGAGGTGRAAATASSAPVT